MIWNYVGVIFFDYFLSGKAEQIHIHFLYLYISVHSPFLLPSVIGISLKMDMQISESDFDIYLTLFIYIKYKQTKKYSTEKAQRTVDTPENIEINLFRTIAIKLASSHSLVYFPSLVLDPYFWISSAKKSTESASYDLACNCELCTCNSPLEVSAGSVCNICVWTWQEEPTTLGST